jgi:hypothetical protein
MDWISIEFPVRDPARQDWEETGTLPIRELDLMSWGLPRSSRGER